MSVVLRHAVHRSRRWVRGAVALSPALACSGCDMLGALFDTRQLRGIVLVVAVMAIVAFVVSRSRRR